MPGDNYILHGRVLDVYQEHGGSPTNDGRLAGHTTLSLEDASDFAEEGGTLVLQDGTLAEYDSADMDTDVISLTDPLPLDVPEDTFIAVHPLVSWRDAAIQVDEIGDDPLTVRVPHHYWPLLPLGARSDNEREHAVIWYDGEDWAIIDIGGTAKAKLSSDVASNHRVHRYTAEGEPTDGYFGIKDTDPFSGTIQQVQVVFEGTATVNSLSTFDMLLNGVSFATVTVSPGVGVVSSPVAVSVDVVDTDKLRVDFTNVDYSADHDNPVRVYFWIVENND